MQDPQPFTIHLPISSSDCGFKVLLGTKPGQTMEVGHTGHVLFGIVTTDTTSQIPFTLEIRVQMDSYIEVVLQVLLLDHDRRYLPKA